eukprot:Skav202512  [mRNA]  locus=scaffold1359:169685:175086:- [translate_table: standard]
MSFSTLKYAKKYTLRNELCPCLSRASVLVATYEVVSMSPNAVSLRGTLAQEANRIRLWYGDRPLFPDKCPHDTTRFVSIRISMSQWTHVVQHATSFVLVNAKVTAAFRMHLDSTDGLSSATTLRMSRDELGWSMINTVELFAGGFSGWTHAVRSLSSEGFAFNQFLALDHDLDCAESYMASHPVDTRVGPGDLSWTEDDLPGSMFVVCELSQLNWIHLIGVLPIHMLLMSPPCPAWSLATNRAGGLDREDGQVMLEVWGALSLLRPKVIDMENVATLMSHHHWPQIQEFINWCGFQVRWSITLNLNQVLPQNRDRMLLIATCYEDDSLQLHTCIGWPVYAPPTIDDSFIFMSNVEPWISQVRLTDELVKLYLDPASLPRKAIAGLDSQHKRTKLDVLSYRCKFGPDVATCIMANYGFAHELPSHTLQAGGLYGCVVIREDGIRFFQPHEVALLMGATQDVWLPLEAKKALKLMGNAIAVPHASIALCNSLAFLNADLTPNEVTALFVKLFGHRHTASEVSVTTETYGIRMTALTDGIPPTVPLKKMYSVHLHHGSDHVIIRMQIGTRVFDALSLLFHGQTMTQILFMPNGKAAHEVPIPKDFRITDFDFHLRITVPIILNINPRAFHDRRRDVDDIAVLTTNGVVFVRGFPQMRIQEVLHTIHVCDISEEVTCVNMVGHVLPLHMQTPSAFMLIPDAPQTADASALKHLYVTHSLEGISFSGTHQYLESFRQMVRVSGLHNIIQALGWVIAMPLNEHEDLTFTHFTVAPKHGAMSIVQQDMCNCLLVHLFLIMIKSLSLSGDSANLTCRFKLFGTWVWRGEIDAQANLRPISQIWHSLRAIVGDTLGIRFLFQGQIIGASAPLASFLDPSDMLDASMDITLVPGQHGGGPVDLQDISTQDIRRVVSRTRSLAAIEEESFSEGMKALFQMWHELPSQERILEPSSLLEVQTFVEDGMLVFQDDLENIFPMNRVFKFTGMELALDRAGWKVSVQFVQFGRPAKARLLVFPSPVGESMSIRAVREFIRACFVTFCFPKPVRESRKSALIRAKLWGVRFFEGFLKLDAPMSDMYDAWDQASSFVGDPMPYRIVALGKLTIQENLMRDYIPADKPRDSHTTFVFMPPQHGGGPAVSDAIVRTKNQLATLLINAGAHLEDLTPFIDKMFTQVGHVAIQQALGTKPAADKWKALRQMASGASIEFPTLSPKERDAGKRIKDKLAQLNKDQQDQLIPNLLTLQEGFFVNMDGSNSTQLDRLQPNACGVVIMTPKEAEPWISANQKISPDELAILVLGHCLCDDRSKCKVTNVPMFNKAGFPIIVQGVLHQMGQVPIEVSSDSDVQIQVGDSTVISVTTFRDELDPAKWVEVTQKPIRTCLLLLLGIDDKLDLASPPWGRNFAKGKARSDPSSATSFQFHIRVNASDVSRVLKASGTNGVYTVPKTDTHLVSDKYQIIWVQLSLIDIQVLAASHSENLGIVRNFRIQDKPSRGIRFAKTDYARVWPQIKPNQDMPTSVAAKFLYKISPTPKGATSEAVQKFCDSQSWPARPLRALNSSMWLLGASEKIEAVFSSWNGQPLLLQSVQQRVYQDDVLVAGTLPRLARETMPSVDNPNAPPGDPWATWISNHGSTGLLATGVKPIAAPTAAPAAPRKVEGPIEDRFQAQDDNLKQLRQDTQQQLDQIRTDLSMMSEGLTLQNARIDANQAAVETEFQLVRQETSDQFTALAQTFKTSLSQSLENQDNKIQLQFGELKKLLTDRPTKPPKKKAKGAEASEDSL